VTGDAQRRPPTDEQRARSESAIEQLKRDLAEARGRPRPPVNSPGKFTAPVGLNADGELQAPLTPEEAAHDERARRQGPDPDGEE
jgi:hypothetical protein